jgi:ketosteroid isomerase-like protein
MATMTRRRILKSRHRWLFAALAPALALGSGATPAATPQTSQEQITRLELHLQELFNSREFWTHPELATRYYDAPRVRMWDIMPPAEFRGAQALQDHYHDLVTEFSNGKIEFLALEVEADQSIGFATMFQHFTATSAGKPIDMTMRVTDCLHKVHGQWLISHEHISLPIEPAILNQMIAAKP